MKIGFPIYYNSIITVSLSYSLSLSGDLFLGIPVYPGIPGKNPYVAYTGINGINLFIYRWNPYSAHPPNYTIWTSLSE